MLTFGGHHIFLVVEPTDMRKSFNLTEPGPFGFRVPCGQFAWETMGPHRFLGDPSRTSALIKDPGRTRRSLQ